jgi:hypothetical protein
MEMIPMSSSAILAAGYDSGTMRMKIRFVQGHTYEFCRVPAHIFDGLRHARSKGSYYSAHIRDHYRC